MRSMTSTKKLVTLCLCILLVAGAWVPLATTEHENTTAENDPAWQVTTGGTRSDPIMIYNVWDLQNMSNDLTAHYALANDIDASATEEWNDGAGFEPIGTSANQFTGSCDGRGYEIAGLYINRPRMDSTGLFGSIGRGGTVTNVGLVDVDVTGRDHVGGLVASNSGLVSYSYAAGRVTGVLNFVGGLVGANADQGSVENSHTMGSLSGRYSVGGLVGDNKGRVSNSYATGTVHGFGHVGGLVGANADQGSVNDSYATGTVNGHERVGGLMGSNTGSSASVSNCHASGNVTGEQWVGGLLGQNSGLGASVSSCYATGSVTGKFWVGGLVGLNEGSGASVSNCYAMGRVQGRRPIGALVGENSGSVENCYATGNVSGNGQLGGLVGLNEGSVSNSHYNIDSVLINGGNHVTLGGLFQDQYHDWFNSGMKLDSTDYDSTLVPSGDYFEISSIDGIRDLLGFAGIAGFKFRLVSDIDLSTAPGLYVPYLAAEFDGNHHTISNLLLKDIPVAVLGMFGFISFGGFVSNLGMEDMDITGYYAGGLVGQNRGSVENCYATGTVSRGSGLGGLVGSNYGSVSNSYATGSVNGGGYLGGLVGWNYGSISNSYATGSVSGGSYMGGLVGSNGDYWAQGGTVSNCYASGSVNGDGEVGGLLGWNSGLVENCYATGRVKGGSMNGGLVGENYGRGTVSNCFWDTQTSGQSKSSGGTGTTSAAMGKVSTYTTAGWDIISVSDYDERNFNYTWNIVDGRTYPFLSRNPSSLTPNPLQETEQTGSSWPLVILSVLLVALLVLLAMVTSDMIPTRKTAPRKGTTRGAGEHAKEGPHPGTMPDAPVAPPSDGYPTSPRQDEGPASPAPIPPGRDPL